jgi:hypothetical protein
MGLFFTFSRRDRRPFCVDTDIEKPWDFDSSSNKPHFGWDFDSSFNKPHFGAMTPQQMIWGNAPMHNEIRQSPEDVPFQPEPIRERATKELIKVVKEDVSRDNMCYVCGHIRDRSGYAYADLTRLITCCEIMEKNGSHNFKLSWSQ